MDENTSKTSNWRLKEKTVKSVGENGELETTTYELKSRKKLGFDEILKIAGLLTLVTPFLLLYFQRCNEAKNNRLEKLSDTYIQFSKDIKLVMEKKYEDKDYNIAIENLNSAYKTRFDLFGPGCIGFQFDSILKYVAIRNAMVKLNPVADSFIAIAREKYFLRLTDQILSKGPESYSQDEAIFHQRLQNFGRRAQNILGEISMNFRDFEFALDSLYHWQMGSVYYFQDIVASESSLDYYVSDQFNMSFGLFAALIDRYVRFFDDQDKYEFVVKRLDFDHTTFEFPFFLFRSSKDFYFQYFKDIVDHSQSELDSCILIKTRQ